jgi:hypothetical protein
MKRMIQVRTFRLVHPLPATIQRESMSWCEQNWRALCEQNWNDEGDAAVLLEGLRC